MKFFTIAALAALALVSEAIIHDYHAPPILHFHNSALDKSRGHESRGEINNHDGSRHESRGIINHDGFGGINHDGFTGIRNHQSERHESREINNHDGSRHESRGTNNHDRIVNHDGSRHESRMETINHDGGKHESREINNHDGDRHNLRTVDHNDDSTDLYDEENPFDDSHHVEIDHKVTLHQTEDD